jgi:lipopolysaccharide/colanic/teichoic acid biosynthesis glycosyltransferase
MTDSTSSKKMMNTYKSDFPTHWGMDVTKRILDIVLSLMGLLILSPILALIAFLVKRDSPGPVFYWGPRIGRNGRIFKMLKFRTMYETEKSYQGPRVTGKGDDRITPLGKWLRDTKLNEFPQLWNVLIGEMSLVGPRPEDPSISKTWPISIARELLSVRPGVTSPASVVYRDEENMLHAGEIMRKYLHELSPDKMRLDQLYIRYRSIWLDMDVLLWTVLLLLPRIKSYSPPEDLLIIGPVTRFMQRYMGWFVSDFLIILASIGITGATVRLFGPLDLGWPRAIQMALGFALLYSLVGLVLDSNRIYWPKAAYKESGRLFAGWFIATSTSLGLNYYLGFGSLRTYGVILFSSLIALTGIVIIRFQTRFVRRIVSWQMKSLPTRERVLIVGSGRTAEHFAWLMGHPACLGKYKVIGFLDDDLRTQGMKIYGSRVIGRISDIATIIEKQDIGLVVLADTQTSSDKYKEYLEKANFNMAKVIVAPDIFGSLSGLDKASSNDEVEVNVDMFA